MSTIDTNFTVLSGSYTLANRLAKDLSGLPPLINGDLRIQESSIMSFKGGPAVVRGNVYAAEMKLTNLKYSPHTVDGLFDVTANNLSSLVDGPKTVVDSYYASENRLTSLKGIGSVGGSVSAELNPISNLKDVHKDVGYIGKTLYLLQCPIKSHVLGLLLIEGLEMVMLDNKDVQRILNKNLPSKGIESVLEAQDELIVAGLEEYAQL